MDAVYLKIIKVELSQRLSGQFFVYYWLYIIQAQPFVASLWWAKVVSAAKMHLATLARVTYPRAPGQFRYLLN